MSRICVLLSCSLDVGSASRLGIAVACPRRSPAASGRLLGSMRARGVPDRLPRRLPRARDNSTLDALGAGASGDRMTSAVHASAGPDAVSRGLDAVLISIDNASRRNRELRSPAEEGASAAGDGRRARALLPNERSEEGNRQRSGPDSAQNPIQTRFEGSGSTPSDPIQTALQCPRCARTRPPLSACGAGSFLRGSSVARDSQRIASPLERRSVPRLIRAHLRIRSSPP